MKSEISHLTIMLFLCCGFGNAMTSFEKECLDRHNHLRKLHGAQPLKYNATISKISAKWASTLISQNSFHHSKKKNLGENLWSGSSTSVTYTIDGKTPVDSWHSEKKYYKDYKNEPSDVVKSKTGHYTQVIWRKTTQLGIGIAKKSTKNGTTYVVVCNYYPPGNFRNEYTKNVFPEKK